MRKISFHTKLFASAGMVAGCFGLIISISGFVMVSPALVKVSAIGAIAVGICAMAMLWRWRSEIFNDVTGDFAQEGRFMLRLTPIVLILVGVWGLLGNQKQADPRQQLAEVREEASEVVADMEKLLEAAEEKLMADIEGMDQEEWDELCPQLASDGGRAITLLRIVVQRSDDDALFNKLLQCMPEDVKNAVGPLESPATEQDRSAILRRIDAYLEEHSGE